MAAVVSLVGQADKDAAEARRWQRELQLAHKREKPWREDSEKLIKRYRAEEKKRNRYNVLWSNTEILRPAYYNSKPQPDVRRRFRDADPLGKAVSEVLERSLQVVTDGYSTDCALKNDVLDGLLCGRGISRVRYVPKITQKEPPPKAEDDTLPQEAQEEVDYEQACIEHVDWRDFRHGYGRVWDEVPWVGFRHRLTKPDAKEKFEEGDIAGIKFATPQVEDRKESEDTSEMDKVAEFWEIWDKVGERVFFLQEDVKQLLYPKDNPGGTPPLEFEGFFCCPEPLRLVENTGSLLPIPPFHLYEEQANELDRISARIDKIVDKLRLRGVYDAKLPEIASVTEASDNELVPIQNAQSWSDKGLDAAISWMPIEQAAKVLESLYEARERQKAIIDELTGISDIRRGATSAEETATAQEIKQNNGDVRLLRPRQEVQRYARDLLRLCASVMAQKFAPQTFAEMTDLSFPTLEQKAALQSQAQLGQVDPALLQVPTWEDILSLMRSPGLRKFKIDVETDSTVAGMLQSDMGGLKEVMEGVHEMLTGLAPIVASGALPPEAAKELVMVFVRRARLGMAVEDALEKLKAPNPPPPPPQPQVEAAKIKAQSDQQLAGIKAQTDVQVAQAEQAAQAQSRQAELQLEAQKAQAAAQIEVQKDAQLKAHEVQLKQLEADLETKKLAMQLENDRLIADATNQTKVIVAEIQAKVQLQKQVTDVAKTAMQGEQAADQQQTQIEADAVRPEGIEAPPAANYEKVESEFIPLMKELLTQLSKPRRVVRDENGKLVGLQ